MIEFREVCYVYPTGVKALEEVSLQVDNGEFLAIMGQNGAGKTTLVKHINGLLKPTSGEVLVEGVDTTKVSVASLSRKVGFVFQNPDHQLFSETVEDEINFGLKNFGFDEKIVNERVEWALNLLDLSNYRKVSPFMLSGGERKRVALASVLAWDPEIVILDEPTIGQDHLQKERLGQFIVQLNQQNRTVIIVTHDIEFVAECKPKVVLMSKGRIIAQGGAQKVLTNQDWVERSRVDLPEIARIFQKLSVYGFPSEVIDVYEAHKILLERAQKYR